MSAKSYNNDMSKILGLMGTRIDRCNSKYRKEMSKVLDQYRADLKRLTVKHNRNITFADGTRS